ncbi:MAG: hypothetical protein KDD34_04735, partial [Bdellovibrionales bacterium]|nr:hypothetical protein [Bdellovibrionales bacterium]
LNYKVNQFYLDFTRTLFSEWMKPKSEVFDYIENQPEINTHRLIQLMKLDWQLATEAFQWVQARHDKLETALKDQKQNKLKGYTLPSESELAAEKFWQSTKDFSNFSKNLDQFLGDLGVKKVQSALFYILNQPEYFTLKKSEKVKCLQLIEKKYSLNELLITEITFEKVLLSEQNEHAVFEIVRSSQADDLSELHPLLRRLFSMYIGNNKKMNLFFSYFEKDPEVYLKFASSIFHFIKVRKPYPLDFYFQIMTLLLSNLNYGETPGMAIEVLMAYKGDIINDKIILTPFLDALSMRAKNHRLATLSMLKFMNEISKNTIRPEIWDVSRPKALIQNGIDILNTGKYPKLLVQWGEYLFDWHSDLLKDDQFQKEVFDTIEKHLLKIRNDLTSSELTAIRNTFGRLPSYAKNPQIDVIKKLLERSPK